MTSGRDLYTTDLERRLYDPESDRPVADARRGRRGGRGGLGWLASLVGVAGGFGLAYWLVRRQRHRAARPRDPSQELGTDDDDLAA